jgi:carotenoid cleavage dioxygenase-like enzyme
LEGEVGSHLPRSFVLILAQRYQTDPFFAFHSLNSFDDEDNSVVIDIACYKDYNVHFFCSNSLICTLISFDTRC